MRDLFNNIHPLRAISPAAAVADNTPWVGQWIDRVGAEGGPYDSLTFVINTGGEVDADATFTVLVEDADLADYSDSAAVPDAALLGTEALASFTFADDNETRKIGYVGGSRYVRLTITPGANSANAFASAVAILGHPAVAPTPNAPV